MSCGRRSSRSFAEHELPYRTGRPRADQRAIFDAITFRLRSGCQWNRLPKVLPGGSSVHRAFQRWVGLGVLDRIWQALLRHARSLAEPIGTGRRRTQRRARPVLTDLIGPNLTEGAKNEIRRNFVPMALYAPSPPPLAGGRVMRYPWSRLDSSASESQQPGQGPLLLRLRRLPRTSRLKPHPEYPPAVVPRTEGPSRPASPLVARCRSDRCRLSPPPASLSTSGKSMETIDFGSTSSPRLSKSV